MRAREMKGFTLIELMIVVAIIGIIAAIAMPNLRNFRRTGYEASAIGSLRAINAAQQAFAASCGNGLFAPTLARLGAPPTVDGGEGFIGPDLNTDPSVKSNYTITLTPGTVVSTAPPSCNGAAAGTVVSTYFVSAVPTDGGGIRHFGTSGNTIYQSTTNIPVTLNGQPAGAAPIQ